MQEADRDMALGYRDGSRKAKAQLGLQLERNRASNQKAFCEFTGSTRSQLKNVSVSWLSGA